MAELSGALRWWVIGVAVAIGMFSTFMGWSMFPMPGRDSCDYVAPAVNLLGGHGLVNPAWEVCREGDASGRARFLQYPPLFPLTVAAFAARADVPRTFAVLGLINLATLLAAAGLCLRAIRGAPAEQRSSLAVCALLAVPALATWTGNHATGRPDILASLLIAVSTLAATATSGRLQASVLGVSLGLLGATHPAAAVIGALAVSTWFAGSFGGAVSRWAGALALTGSIAALVCAGMLMLGPYPIAEVVRGIAAHARMVAVTSEGASGIYYFFLQPNAFGYGFVFVLLLIGAGFSLQTRPPALVLATGGLCLLTVWYFALRSPNRAYNLLLFSPVLFPALLRLISNPAEERARVGRRWATIAVGAAFALCSVGFARQAVVFRVYLAQGVRFEEARDAFRKWERTSTAPPLVTLSLWALAADPSTVRLETAVRDPVRQRRELPPGALYFLQQAYSGLPTAPDLPGFKREWENFRSGSVRFAGLPIANQVPGYSFAVYRRVADDRSESSKTP